MSTYMLAYSTAENGDAFEIFPTEDFENPAEAARHRLEILQGLHQVDTWNIARVEHTSEHYTLDPLPADENGEKQPADIDWNAEATRLGEMREKAIAYLESTAKGNDDDIEFITSNGRGAVLYDTTDGFVLIQVGTDGPFYVSDMYEMDNLLSTCACVQKAIAERSQQP